MSILKPLTGLLAALLVLKTSSYFLSETDPSVPIYKNIEFKHNNQHPGYESLKNKNRKVPKYPIILCHGLSGFDKLSLMNFEVHKQGDTDIEMFERLNDEASGLQLDYWNGILHTLIDYGCLNVFIAKVPPMGKIEERAKVLHQFINEKVSQKFKHESWFRNGEKLKINLVGHSMGGLDCRYLISKIDDMEKKYEVVSLTTISSPHQGSEVADYFMELLTPLFLKMDCDESTSSSESFIYLKNRAVHLNPCVVPPSIPQLTTKYMQQTFNKEVKNDPRVKYFSYGARFNPKFLDIFYLPYEIIKMRTAPNLQHVKTSLLTNLSLKNPEINEIAEVNLNDNDGLITVKSAQWGTYLGTLENVDHLDVINWTNPLKRLYNDTIAIREGEESRNFSATDFYLHIADDLAEHGF